MDVIIKEHRSCKSKKIQRDFRLYIMPAVPRWLLSTSQRNSRMNKIHHKVYSIRSAFSRKQRKNIEVAAVGDL